MNTWFLEFFIKEEESGFIEKGLSAGAGRNIYINQTEYFVCWINSNQKDIYFEKIPNTLHFLLISRFKINIHATIFFIRPFC